MAVVGQREADADTVAIRVRGAGNKQEVVAVGEFLSRVSDEIRSRALGMAG